MAYLITKSMYPSHKAAVKSTSQGIGILGVSEVKEGNLDEAYANKVKFMVLFQGIKGFEYSIDINSTVIEALGLLGISPPE